MFDELARLVYDAYPTAYVAAENVERPASFPCVTIVEFSNSTHYRRLDSSGEENAARLTYVVNVYSNSASDAKATCRDILALVDERLRLYNFTRSFARPTDNAADPSVYRITARYSGTVDKNGTYYRR